MNFPRAYVADRWTGELNAHAEIGMHDQHYALSAVDKATCIETVMRVCGEKANQSPDSSHETEAGELAGAGGSSSSNQCAALQPSIQLVAGLGRESEA